MATGLYMDVHVPQAIVNQLRRRGVDVLSAQEDQTDELPDDALLQRSSDLNRLIFTQYIRFKALAEDWQREGRPFAGLVFGHQLNATIGRYIQDLHLIANASESHEWLNVVEHLPYESD